MSLLKVEDMHVYYGNIHAIKGVSFEVNEGEIVTLIGANGAGKSTTLNTIAGLLKPRSGQVVFNGHNVVGMPASKVVSLGMALCPEGRRVFQQMTVRENLEMGGFTRPAGELAGSLDHVFKLFPRLKEREKQVAGTLSGGEQQMLAMGRALMGRPKLLMLDEPSMGLAPKLVDQIFDIIAELHAAGTTILAGGAERADGPAGGLARLRAGNGPHHPRRRRRQTARQRQRARRLSGRLTPPKRQGPPGNALPRRAFARRFTKTSCAGNTRCTAPR